MYYWFVAKNNEKVKNCKTDAIVKEKKTSFEILEKNIFEEVCKLAREYTKAVLESYDDVLSKERDTSNEYLTQT